MGRATPHVVIIGGGFAGLWCTRALASAPVHITLVDKANHHLFQPLLYQVATAGLSAPDIAAPLRHILRRQRNVRVLMGEVTGIDVDRRTVQLQGPAASQPLHYDQLLVASGATHAYFGHDSWAAHALGLKTLDDALAIRRRVLLAFEHAEAAASEEERRAWLHFAIVGGGPTGIECGGVAAEEGFFELSPEVLQRGADAVPARKRALYRRRYAMLDGLAQQIDAAVQAGVSGGGAS